MKIEEKYVQLIVEDENEMVFARFSRLTNKLFSEKADSKEANLALKSQIKQLEHLLVEQKKEIKKLNDRLKKQEFLEKSKEIQKESVKIVVNKAKKSTDNVEIKKIITELIEEIDACIALLDKS